MALKKGWGNENSVILILYGLLPHAKWNGIGKTTVTTYDECLAQKDGVYVVQDIAIPYDWAYADYRCEFDPEKELESILAFARNRFGDNSMEPAIRANIKNFSKHPSLRTIDFAIMEIKNHKVVKQVTIEVASEDHFYGNSALTKTVSDCLKCNGTHTKTYIIDARRPMLFTLEQQVRNAIKSFL